eukprot:maker-scaffold123_size333416-snap-gene-2.20 protein:Tk05324 transcript:maker-scaffold123_size333416-snap-gene-2.20-mRNA-1 annotation:"fumarylacetoacetate hydrolase domain-containing protein 2"
MRFVQFKTKKSSEIKLGVQLEDQGEIVSLSEELGVRNLIEFLELEDGLAQASRIVDSNPIKIASHDILLEAPVTRPDKVLCIGMNYKDHCEEQNAPVPKEPVVFNKFPSCIIGPHDPIPYPPVTEELDWEVELAIVVGKQGRNISEDQAMDYVFGFTVAHDVSARDWQLKKNGGQWLLGKAMDGFCPLGPAVVTKDALPNVHQLAIRCSVNGVSKQNSNTNQLVFKTEAIVAWVSQFCTLQPGDVILTGTPPGVGVFMKPPQFLKRGDKVVCEIENIGKVENEII